MTKESDKMRRINDALEYFRHEIAELYERRPSLAALEDYTFWTNEVIALQTQWIKCLENKIHLVRREGSDA